MRRAPGTRLAGLLLIAALFGCGACGRALGSPLYDRTPIDPSREGDTPSGSGRFGGPAGGKELVLLFTAETRGNLLPCTCPRNPAGGLARRVGFLRTAGGTAPAEDAVLRLDAGGFLPQGEAPLRDDPRAAAAYLHLLLQALADSRVDAAVLDRGQREFIRNSDRPEYARLSRVFVEADPEDSARVLSWGGCRAAIVALDDRMTDSTIVRKADDARKRADILLVLARADAFSGRRVARLSRADLVVLSRGARPQPALREGRVLLVGCGAEGREIGELRLLWEKGRPGLTILDYRLHPMDSTVKEDPSVAEKVRELISAFGPAGSLLGARQ